MADPKILLFTNQFPYGKGEQFLETEIIELARHSQTIEILPSVVIGTGRALPENVSLNLSYAAYLKQTNVRKLIWLVRHFITLIKGLSYHQLFILQGDAVKRIVKFIYVSSRSATWLKANQNSIDSSSILYTYWFEAATHGLARFGKGKYKIKTRAHGQDLYQERHDPQFFPFREESIRLVNEIFVVSQHGFEYLSQKYPFGHQKYRVSFLGVKDPGFVTKPSDDGVLRIVSCAFMVEVKRLELLFESLVLLAHRYPQKEIVWYHLGDGPLMKPIQEIIDRRSPSNLNCKLLGAFSNQGVMDFYQQNALDVFANVSRSEGVPVSIMEAFSCSIPAVATAVGGTPEIVNDENGILLSPNPNPVELSEVLSQCFTEKIKEKRAKAKLTWQDHYQAERNYHEFYQMLVT